MLVLIVETVAISGVIEAAILERNNAIAIAIRVNNIRTIVLMKSMESHKTVRTGGEKMKLAKKDLLVLAIPLVIMILLIPILPDKIPMQWSASGEVNWYLDKRLSFLLGLVPFIINQLWKTKNKK